MTGHLRLFWTSQSCADQGQHVHCTGNLCVSYEPFGVPPLPAAKLWDTVCQRSVSGTSANSFLLSQAGLRRTSLIRQGRQSSSLSATMTLGSKQHGCALSYTYIPFLTPF